MDIQHVSVILAALNTLLIPAVLGVGRYLMRVERRLLRIEIRIGGDTAAAKASA